MAYYILHSIKNILRKQLNPTMEQALHIKEITFRFISTLSSRAILISGLLGMAGKN